MKLKKKRAEKYEPLVVTDLSFDDLLKLAAHTPPEKDKPKQKVMKKKKKS
jgi:hypothetical protein